MTMLVVATAALLFVAWAFGLLVDIVVGEEVDMSLEGVTLNLTIDLTDEYGPAELGDALDRLSREAWAYLISWAEPGEALFVEALTCVSVYGGTGFDSLHRTHADARNRVLELAS